MILGIAFFGKSFTLYSAGNTAVGAPVDTVNVHGSPGYLTKKKGFLSYIEVRTRFKNSSILPSHKKKLSFAYVRQAYGNSCVRSILSTRYLLCFSRVQFGKSSAETLVVLAVKNTAVTLRCLRGRTQRLASHSTSVFFFFLQRSLNWASKQVSKRKKGKRTLGRT